MTDDSRDFWGEPIHTYTRAEALADGVLVDVTETAREAGFAVPVALTVGIWSDVRDIPASKRGYQDTGGRLWDLLHMGRLTASRADALDRDEILYRLHMDLGRKRLYVAKLHIGPGDAGEPAVTIMRPEED
jgi:hypothetical protein